MASIPASTRSGLHTPHLLCQLLLCLFCSSAGPPPLLPPAPLWRVDVAPSPSCSTWGLGQAAAAAAAEQEKCKLAPLAAGNGGCSSLPSPPSKRTAGNHILVYPNMHAAAKPKQAAPTHTMDPTPHVLTKCITAVGPNQLPTSAMARTNPYTAMAWGWVTWEFNRDQKRQTSREPKTSMA